MVSMELIEDASNDNVHYKDSKLRINVAITCMKNIYVSVKMMIV